MAGDVFIIGCGYVGTRVARAERRHGAAVAALVRRDDAAAPLQAVGVECWRGDLDHPESLLHLPLRDRLLYYFAPPSAHGTADARMPAMVAAFERAGAPARVVLISTTGVYGDCRGEWVTEARPPAPRADRARRRWSAEQALGAWSRASGVPVVVLRVPGIYGPGRLPARRLRAREPVLREEDSPYSNRIHVDDLVRACVAAGRPDRPAGVYNVSDGHPTTMTDYFNRAADALGIARPPVIVRAEAETQLSEGMLSYLAESKRLDNRKMREELGVVPAYPDLARGLAASV